MRHKFSLAFVAAFAVFPLGPLPPFTAKTAARPLDRWGSKMWITPDDRRGQNRARTSVTGQTIPTVEMTGDAP